MKRILFAFLVSTTPALPAFADDDCANHFVKRQTMINMADNIGNTYEVVEGVKADRLLELIAIEDIEDKHASAGTGGSVLIIKVKGKDIVTFSTYDKNQFICAATPYTTEEASNIIEEWQSRL